MCSNDLNSQLFCYGGIKGGKFFIHLEVPLVTPVSLLRFLCCIVTSDKIWICYFNPVLSAIILIETYQKLQEEDIHYCAVVVTYWEAHSILVLKFLDHGTTVYTGVAQRYDT